MSFCSPRVLVGSTWDVDSKQDCYEDCPTAIAVKDPRDSLWMWKSNETKVTPCFIEMNIVCVCVCVGDMGLLLISPHVHLHILWNLTRKENAFIQIHLHLWKHWILSTSLVINFYSNMPFVKHCNSNQMDYLLHTIQNEIDKLWNLECWGPLPFDSAWRKENKVEPVLICLQLLRFFSKC